jgi:threo-3-hydroxy-L-aspartate ammonia-lyase
MHEYKYDNEPFNIIQPEEIALTHKRIVPYIHRTPLITSALLNNWLGHEIIFKAENFQKIGAFKARGAINKILSLKEQGKLPERVVAFSAGNHSQAVAWAAKQFGIDATIFLPEIVSSIKIQATKAYGAQVIITKTRQQAEDRTAALAKDGACLVHAYDDDAIITGQGTAAFEALLDMGKKPDAILAACGGGGLLSGTYLATALLSPATQVFGVEPKIANDATNSYNAGKLYRFNDSPNTIADGVRTLSLSPRTFHYIQNIDGFIESKESEICYWVQWLSHLLKITVEPTAALAMAGAHRWLAQQTAKKRILVILSGGNIAPDVQQQILQENHLATLPS